jgi:hypothetical protein
MLLRGGIARVQARHLNYRDERANHHQSKQHATSPHNFLFQTICISCQHGHLPSSSSVAAAAAAAGDLDILDL